MDELRIGTAEGLHGEDTTHFAGQPVRVFGDVAIVGGVRLCWHGRDGWREVGTAPGLLSAVDAPGGLLVGTEGARLLRLGPDGLDPVATFDAIDGRDQWYTPWGGPPDTRTLACSDDNVLFAGIHVGGVVRSDDGARRWQPVLDIEVDVHEVRAAPGRSALVLAATAVGLCRSDDGGVTWKTHHDGLHATYARAVAVGDEHVYLSASEGPRGRRSALYRAPLDDPDAPFEQCSEWLPGNVDTLCLDASGSTVAYGTASGDVLVSSDAGATWSTRDAGLAPVTSVRFA